MLLRAMEYSDMPLPPFFYLTLYFNHLEEFGNTKSTRGTSSPS